MRKLFVSIIIFICLKSIGQNQSSLNYFYNLSYSNPAFSSNNKFQLDLNSNSYYNALPQGIYSVGFSTFFLSKNKVGASATYNSTFIGKATKQNVFQVFFNYDLELNFKSKLNFGIGVKSVSSTIDETRLTTDINQNTLEYFYGDQIQKSSKFLLPIGIEFRNKTLKTGAYFSKGFGIKSQYGAYFTAQTFETEIKEFILKNYSGVSFYQEILNPIIAISNTSELDNYKFDLFAKYNLSSEISSYFNFGAGIHYHWKIYDINYHVAANNRGLGLSHQIGIQFFY